MSKQEKLTNDRKREIALDLYLNTDKSQKEICEIIGCTEKTFGNWKEKFKWEHLKGASTITARNIISKLYTKLEALTDEEVINADKLIKVAKSIEMLSDRKVTISHHINCAKEFTSWVAAKDVEMAKRINTLQYEFINERASNA